MSYTPNFSDPRVVKRTKQALGFSLACIGSKPSRWAKVALDKHFGSQNHPLSKFLRTTLLVTRDDHYSMDDHLPKEYVLNPGGVEYLRAALRSRQKSDRGFGVPDKSPTSPFASKNPDQNPGEDHLEQQLLLPAPPPSVAQVSDRSFDQELVDAWATREFGEELLTLAFTYEDKSSRLWHPLQNVRRTHKKRLQASAGLTWHYDIECCAPTLLLQHSQLLPEPMDLWLFAYQFYLSNRTLCRERLATTLGVDLSYAKTVLNALFCGAKLGVGDDFSLYRLLGSAERIHLLKQDVFVTNLRQDIKTVWSYIEPTLTRIEKKDKNGRSRKVPLSSRRKWNLYFDLERQVLNVVHRYLKDTNNPCFLEHDGWVTRDRINVDELRALIHAKTGFDIRLEEEHHEQENA